jgi:hypothetical protein
VDVPPRLKVVANAERRRANAWSVGLFFSRPAGRRLPTLNRKGTRNMKVRIKQGPSIFTKARDAKPTKVAGDSSPAVVSPRARKAIPKSKRSPNVKTPGGGRALTAAESSKVFEQLVAEFRREFGGGVVNLGIDPQRLCGFAQRFVANHGLVFERTS